jgi:hypothetical protein
MMEALVTHDEDGSECGSMPPLESISPAGSECGSMPSLESISTTPSECGSMPSLESISISESECGSSIPESDWGDSESDDEYADYEETVYYTKHAGRCEITRCYACLTYYCEGCKVRDTSRKPCLWYSEREHFFCSQTCSGVSVHSECSIYCFYVDRKRIQRKG